VIVVAAQNAATAIILWSRMFIGPSFTIDEVHLTLKELRNRSPFFSPERKIFVAVHVSTDVVETLNSNRLFMDLDTVKTNGRIFIPMEGLLAKLKTRSYCCVIRLMTIAMEGGD